MPTSVRSHAKINLGLGIGAPRADGFHGLVTVYQTLELHDLVAVSARQADTTAIRITSNDRRVPVDGRNTAWKMVELALRALELSAEVSIHIEKQLPVQGGLGAGSANAVAALVGMEVELGIVPTSQNRDLGHPGELGFSPSHPWRDEAAPRMGHPDFLTVWGEKRLELAAQVGSDVPLFLVGGTVQGLDRGQRVSPLPDIVHVTEPAWCVVAIPPVGVSTPQAFRDWDELCLSSGLTAEASEAKLKELSRAYASSFGGVEAWDGSSGVFPDEKDLAGPQVSALVRTGIANDFEQVVFPQHPLLSEIKRTLAAAGTPEAALHASLSGSGSALYGLYRDRGDAEAARERLRAMQVESLLTRTLPRAQYWRQMLESSVRRREADPSLRSG
jgi:4-diphosphocytidyl-2-C-methyl-D-erythritol kinase